MILTDIDDVVLHWISTFSSWKEGKGLPILKGPDYECGAKFNQTHHFKRLPAYQDALEVLPRLAKKMQLIGITCCGTDPEIKKARVENLEWLFGPIFEEVWCIDIHDSKMPILEKYPPAIYIDDSLKHVKDASEAGHRSFLIKRTWNADDHDLAPNVVHDWHEIEDMLS